MALYSFVATPVSFWHHHIYPDTVASALSDKKETSSFSKSTSRFSEANCEICSHQYSTYNDGTFVLFAAPFFNNKVPEVFYYSSIPSAPLLAYFNKGPPALA